MKTTSQPAAAKAAAIAACGLLGSLTCSAQGISSTIPSIPSGWLTAFPTIVQTGTKPTLTWSITYPSVVEDYVNIIGGNTISAKEDLDVEVRVLGNGVTVHNTAGQFINWVDAQGQLSFNGGSYNQIFRGTNLVVNPNTVVWSKKKVTAGETLRFGGRYNYNNQWGPTYTSSSGTQNVRTLVNGSLPPSTGTPMHLTPTLEDFLRPYLDGNGRVKIGPMDVIVFMELTHTGAQQSDPGYDLQDLVLLVTFKTDKPKNNNGHGNNIDGIDSSNPGNAPFMQYDTDPNVDDEGSGGGAYPSNP